MMTIDAFRSSVSSAAPPADLGPALQACGGYSAATGARRMNASRRTKASRIATGCTPIFIARKAT